MDNKVEWETRSLQWIHQVREEMDREIREKDITPSQWVKSRGDIDISQLCQNLGLNNFTVKSVFRSLKK